MTPTAIFPTISVALVTHVWTPDIERVFERLQAEAPPDHTVRFLLSADADSPDAKLPPGQLVRISREDLFRLPYPRKCHDGGWVIAGNLDLVFLEFRRRLPDHAQYWFIEYDVHYEGHWSRLFEHFRASSAALLGAIQEYIAKVPHKLDLGYPHLSVPAGMAWNEADQVKGFYPICRLSAALLDALDADYREGLGGHYEIILPSITLRHHLEIEDFGGNGPFVRAENRDRFYFANPSSYSHSPGNFVFRPGITKVLPRPNTLWHPVKPAGVPLWYPLRFTSGNVLRNWKEMLKRQLGQAWIRWWFATRWRPLR